ncbi:MAG: type III pantothenate kinase, partial [Hyphomonadaceae bacterium]|nr:type III pantothenate kinase [Hyphomonadaceae bacterium]
MLLVIDVGNTNSKFAVHDGRDWVGTWRASTNSTRTADEYVVWLDACLKLAGLSLENLNH